MGENLRVLQIGHGGMGRLYAEALRRRGALAGLVVSREPSAAALRRSCDEPVWTSLDEALDRCRPDAVSVLSPTRWHACHTRAALARGLPVLLIKPVCVRPDTARALHEAARRAGAPVFAAHEGVFQPPFVALERAIGEGRIGRLLEVRWLKQGRDGLSGGRTMDPERPEDRAGTNFGFVYASVMHELYAANRLAGRRAPHNAEVETIHASRSEMKLDARLTWSSGPLLRIRYDLEPTLPFRRGLHVIGEEGSVLWLMEPGRTRLALTRGRQTRDLPFSGVEGGNPALAVVDEFLASVRRGGEPPESLEDGALALEAARLLTASAASRAGHPVELDAVAGGCAEVHATSH